MDRRSFFAGLAALASVATGKIIPAPSLPKKPSLTPEQFAGLTEEVLAKYRKVQWVDICDTYRDYIEQLRKESHVPPQTAEEVPQGNLAIVQA